MNLFDFFKRMEWIHFVFGIPLFPENLNDAPEGIVE